MANAFKSARLVYRAVEKEDDQYIKEWNADTESVLNSAPFLPVPSGQSSATRAVEYLQKCFLGVIICLPPTSVSSGPSTTTADGDTKGKTEVQPTTQENKPTPIGFITLSAIDPRFQHHRHSEIGIIISREHQGQGYGSEAILWILNWAFFRANLHRVEIGTFGWNQRALSLYKRLGFKLESTRRDFFFHEGRFWDAYGLCMLEDEWRALYGPKDNVK